VNPRACAVKARLKRALASLAYFARRQTAKARRRPFAAAPERRDDGAHTPEPPEIVPQALRYRFGWDERHDAAAAQIIAKFNLSLPRDRELIRQLAFVRVAQAQVMPFGKYKGWLIEDVLDNDPDYLEWLASQPDFPQRHPRLYQTIVENDLGPEEPEENSGDDEFVEWKRANPPPDLQELVAAHGGYDRIPPEAWAAHDQAMTDWQERRRTRFHVERIPGVASSAKHSPIPCRTCGGPAHFGYHDKTNGVMHWYCAEHRLAQWWAGATSGAPR
jgi:uncharacterized protein (DUF3820 family)